MRSYSFAVAAIVGLLLAALVGIVGPKITNFDGEGVLWGLLAILVFVAVVFDGRRRGSRL